MALPLPTHRTLVLLAVAALFVPARAAGAQTDEPDAGAPATPDAATPDAGAPADATPENAAGPAPAGGPPKPAWIPQTQREQDLMLRHGDHHLAVVGDEVITRDAIIGELQSGRVKDPTEGIPNLTAEERQQALFLAALEQSIESRLKVQGGRNQGYEPEMVRAIRDRYFERQVKNWGGPTEATTVIAGMGMTPDEFRKFLEQRLLAQFWEDSVTGRSVGAGGRQFIDPFVRPGKLFSRYRAYKRDPNPKFNAIVGKMPEQTVLQRLLIDSAQWDNVAEAERLAKTLQENIVSGVLTFEQAYNEYAAFRGEESTIRGATEAIVSTLADIHPGVDLEEFLRKAPIDGITQVVRVDIENVAPVFALYRMVERIAATKATPFVDLGLQTALREAIQGEESEIRVARGLGDLVRSTYVAPADIRDALLNRGRRQRRPRRQ